MMNPFRVKDEKERRLVILAVIFFMVAVILFSWQISYSIETIASGGGPPVPGTQEEVDQNIINAKAYLEDIGTELDSIASLL